MKNKWISDLRISISHNIVREYHSVINSLLHNVCLQHYYYSGIWDFSQEVSSIFIHLLNIFYSKSFLFFFQAKKKKKLIQLWDNYNLKWQVLTWSVFAFITLGRSYRFSDCGSAATSVSYPHSGFLLPKTTLFPRMLLEPEFLICFICLLSPNHCFSCTLDLVSTRSFVHFPWILFSII